MLRVETGTVETPTSTCTSGHQGKSPDMVQEATASPGSNCFFEASLCYSEQGDKS